MFRDWYGPAIGVTVAHVWVGYAARIFLELGRLHPASYVRRDGKPGNPHGDFTLTTMDCPPEWSLASGGRNVTSEMRYWKIQERWLRLLIGRRLQRLQIDANYRSTTLTFSEGVILTTWSDIRRPHWELCSMEGASARGSSSNCPGRIRHGTAFHVAGLERRRNLGRVVTLPPVRRANAKNDVLLPITAHEAAFAQRASS